MKLSSVSFVVLLCAAAISGCSTVSSSSVPYVSEGEQTVGKVSLVPSPVPEDVGFEVVGQVKANARAGYSGAASLYPLLADEARKVGANAVINVEGGRRVSAFSWAAPFAGGTAIKIDDPDKLTEFGGEYY